MFLGHSEIAALAKQLARARVAVRRAKRVTTKFESKSGQGCHRDLHEAETVLDQALRALE